MKKKSYLLTVILCVSMLAAAAAGCGSSSEEPKDIVPAGEAAGEAVSEAAEEETKEETKEEAPEEKKEAAAAVSIEEQVLVDQDGVKITATEYTSGGLWGDSVKVLIENNSDKDLTIGCDALIVNDYMITDLFACDVAAGKKANESIDLYSYALKAAGINNVGKIELYFHAFDTDWMDVFRNAYAEIHTSAYDSMDTEPDDAGMELFNEKGIRIVGKTVEEDSFWGKAILLYMENSSGKNVTISVDNMSINGFMVEPYFAATVYDGKKAFDEITLLSSDLEENGIESVEEVELQFNIYDPDTFDTIAASGPITFSAK